MKKLSLLLCSLTLVACFPEKQDPEPDAGIDIPAQEDAITYRELASHPGYTAEGLTYTNASIPGFSGSAKLYAFPGGVTEDTSKPVVLLFHGNSSTPADFEKYPAGSADAMAQLSERLAAAGYKTYAVDFRIDKCDDPQGNNTTENAAKNIDHGWAVPIAMQFIESVIANHEGRKISLIGFSLGTTVMRDAVRKLYVNEKDPFAHIQDFIGLAGANHGVSSYALCGANPTMRGRVACEMGDRAAFSGTPFLNVLNADETPCRDGNTAYGTAGVCGGNAVEYTTVVMRDEAAGAYQDEFVSEASAALNGADNQKIELTDEDLSGYFYGGFFNDHFGSARSAAAINIVMTRLAD